MTNRLEITQASTMPETAYINGGYASGEAIADGINRGELELVETNQEVAQPLERSANFTIRPSTIDDIDDIVEVDLNSFESVYSSYQVDSDEFREELRQKFLGRLEKVGGDWMPVLERDGKIVGFMNCCPTSKPPEQFNSWEETTSDGTLDETYDPAGDNVYVVTLSVLPEGSLGKDMLFAHQIGKATKEGYKQAYFESRLPGFKEWALSEKCQDNTEVLDGLSDEQKDAYADEYFNLFDEVKGRSLRHDKLLRLYERVGCKPVKILRNAYNDDPSLNYGVVFTYSFSDLFDGSYLPVKIPENNFTRKLFGSLIQAASRSDKITRKFFGASEIENGDVKPDSPKNQKPDKNALFEWVRKRKLSLAVGASILSLGAGVAFNPIGKTLKTVENKAEWVLPTEVGLDVAIGVGAVMMASSVGLSIRDPFKAKGKLKDLAKEANDSTLFKTGFVLSTVAGLSWGGIAIGSIISYLPKEAWGATTFPALDLASTVALRKLIWSGIRQAASPESEIE